MQIVGRALRMGGGLKDRAAVRFEHLDPMRHVCGVVVAYFRRDAEIGAQERRAYFCHQLFNSVAFITEALAPKISIETRLAPAQMDVSSCRHVP